MIHRENSSRRKGSGSNPSYSISAIYDCQWNQALSRIVTEQQILIQKLGVDDQPLSESSPDAVAPTSNNELGETKS